MKIMVTVNMVLILCQEGMSTDVVTLRVVLKGTAGVAGIQEINSSSQLAYQEPTIQEY